MLKWFRRLFGARVVPHDVKVHPHLLPLERETPLRRIRHLASLLVTEPGRFGLTDQTAVDFAKDIYDLSHRLVREQVESAADGDFRRYAKPEPSGMNHPTPEMALEIIRYLTGEWLSNPATFGTWAGGCYMEKVHKVACSGLEHAKVVA